MDVDIKDFTEVLHRNMYSLTPVLVKTESELGHETADGVPKTEFVNLDSSPSEDWLITENLNFIPMQPHATAKLEDELKGSKVETNIEDHIGYSVSMRHEMKDEVDIKEEGLTQVSIAECYIHNLDRTMSEPCDTYEPSMDKAVEMFSRNDTYTSPELQFLRENEVELQMKNTYWSEISETDKLQDKGTIHLKQEDNMLHGKNLKNMVTINSSAEHSTYECGHGSTRLALNSDTSKQLIHPTNHSVMDSLFSSILISALFCLEKDSTGRWWILE